MKLLFSVERTPYSMSPKGFEPFFDRPIESIAQEQAQSWSSLSVRSWRWFPLHLPLRMVAKLCGAWPYPIRGF